MARTFLTSVNLAQNELQNAKIQNLGIAPTGPVKGQLYFNSGDNIMYWYNGGSWISAAGGTSAFPGFGGSSAETTFGSTKSDGVGGLAARNDHTHGNPSHLAADHSAIPISALAAATATVNMNSQLLSNLPLPVSNNDAANKQYVDQVAQGLDAKQSVIAATTGTNITLNGGAPTLLDGISLTGWGVGARILVKDQTTQTENGIYTIATMGSGANGTWVRATDMDAAQEFENAYTWVQVGTNNGDTGWVCTTSFGTWGSTPITWTQFAGAGSIIGGAGLVMAGNTMYIGNGPGIVTNSDNIQADFLIVGGDNGNSDKVARMDHAHSGLYLNKAGGAMTGPLTNATSGVQISVPAGVISASTLTSLNQINGNSLSLSGSGAQFTLGGSFSSMVLTNLAALPVLPAITPTNATDAVPKSYVDAQVATAGKRYAASVGGAVTANVAHNLGTRDVQVQVYRVAAPYDTVECDVERTDTNNVTLRFAVAPAASEYRAVVMG